jgi:uncharacterized membrane protein YfcA
MTDGPAAALLLALLFFGAAVLYATVGHAGASAYLAIMALAGMEPTVMRPTALAMNVAVASVVTIQFARAGLVDVRAVLPFVATSIPLAVVGGSIQLPDELYRAAVGAVLLVAAARFLFRPGDTPETPTGAPLVAALALGAGIGLLAGLTGTGGGIFLTPVLILAGWSGTRHAAGTSALFILATSLAGLFAVVRAGSEPAEALPLWLVAVVSGGLIGSALGASRLPVPTLRRALGAVLVVAGMKVILVG